MKAAMLLVGAALLAAASCAKAPDRPAFNAARAVDTIRAGEVQWNADYKAGDAGKVVTHFAPDATVMLPGQAPIQGLEAIRAGVGKAMDDPAFSLTFNSDKVDVAASGDLAVSRGDFTLKSTDAATKAPVTLTGSFVTVYKPQPDGSWKAVWDITTPGPTPAPAK
jgi:uncharacterized protein (TIGR02246 family)